MRKVRFVTACFPICAALLFAGHAFAATQVVLNEVDYDQAGTDAASFIELYNGSPANVDLTDLSVVLVNGATNLEYKRVDLASLGCLASGGYLVIGNSGLPVAQGALFSSDGITGDWIQNGAPDGVALVDTADLTLLDALSYEGSITAAQITGFPGTYNLVEGTPFAGVDTNDNLNSLSRTPNGQDTDNAVTDWALATPSPGAPNGGGPSMPGACNQPPVLNAIGDRSVTAGQTLTFTISATDPNGDPLTFSAANLPFGSSFDAGTRTFSWTPTAAQVGTYAQVHFQTSDGQASDSEDIAITVSAAPVQTGTTTPTSSGSNSTTTSTPTTTGTGTGQPPTTATTLDTTIAKVKVKKRTATVTFNGTGAKSFQCKLDKGRFAACRSPKTYKKLKRGKHVVQVRGLDAAGKPDPTPAKTTFKVKR